MQKSFYIKPDRACLNVNSKRGSVSQLQDEAPHLDPGRPEGESEMWTPRGRLRSSPSGFPRGWTPSCCWNPPRGPRSTSTRGHYRCWPGREERREGRGRQSEGLRGGSSFQTTCWFKGERKWPRCRAPRSFQKNLLNPDNSARKMLFKHSYQDDCYVTGSSGFSPMFTASCLLPAKSDPLQDLLRDQHQKKVLISRGRVLLPFVTSQRVV